MRRLTMTMAAGLTVGLAFLIVGMAVSQVAVASPTLPAISGLYSPTHPDPEKWYPHRRVSLAWAPIAAVAGYSFAFDQDQTTTPGGVLGPSTAPGFAPDAVYGAGPNPRSVTTGDFNEDGWPDLAAVASGGAETPYVSLVSVRLNDGAGGFGERAEFGAGRIPVSIDVGDFNADGHEDVVAANYDGNSVSVLLGDGTGTLGVKHDYRTGGGPYAVAVADLNGDGRADVVTVNVDAGTVSVLLGDGAGGFAAKIDHSIGTWTDTIAVADFNLDGRPDVATTDSGDDWVIVLFGAGNGGFSARKQYAAGFMPESVAAGDLNRDGKPDLAFAHDGRVGVRLGDGAGGFGRKLDYSTGAGAKTVAIGDVTGDGLVDLIVATGEPNTLSVLPGDGAGGFVRGTQFAAGPHASPYTMAQSIALGDFNGDGRSDVALSNGMFDSVNVFMSEPGATVSASTDGLWYFHLSAADGLGDVGPATTIPIRIDTTKPTTAARPASVKRWTVARLRCAVHDAAPCAGWARAWVVVKNNRGKTMREIRLSHQDLGWFSATFRCRLAKGTYRYHVHATDAAGNRQVQVAWNRLVVR